MSNLNTLAEYIHKINKDNGFYDSEVLDSERKGLIIGEMFELMAEHQKGKFCNLENYTERVKGDDFNKDLFIKFVKGTFEDEAADVLIRYLDRCYFKGIDLSEYKDVNDFVNQNFEKVKHLITGTIKSMPALIYDLFFEDNEQLRAGKPEQVVYFVSYIIKMFNINIVSHIELKLEFNKRRPYKHGKDY